MRNPTTRRAFIGLGARAGLVGLGLPAVLAACGGDDDTATTTTAADGTTTTLGTSDTTAAAAPDFGTVDFRLSWTHGMAFGATYVALADGLFAAAGISDVTPVPGGPTATPSPTDVATGMAFAGVAVPDNVAAAIVAGDAQLKIVGALYQKNAYALTSMADDPILTPQDMVGRKIGVQAGNEAVWSAFLTAAGIDPADIEKVAVQFDPTPLTTGEVDGWLSFITGEPVSLRAQGFEVETFLFADHGYPLFSQVYIASDETIAQEREKLKAFLRAEVQGWLAALEDTERVADLVVNDWAVDLGLDLDTMIAVGEAQKPLIITADTQANGLLTMSDALIAENLATIALSGTEIGAEELFDTSLLDEVYTEDPSLVEAAGALTVPS